MHPMLNIAVRAARSAGNVIARGFETFDDLQIEQKGENDFVTKIDREAEQTIIYKIKQSYPDHTLVVEEACIVPVYDDYNLIIDPLDVTTNFIKVNPHFAISIAL